MEELSLQANGVRFHALAAGPKDGRLVLLLHGFPELALSWTAQVTALGEAGYRAVAPDLRGYGGTDKVGPYDLQTLASDVAALVQALGRERAVIVGHDWGGGVAWAIAVYRPEVIERLIILNCPHPAALGEALLSNPRQVLRSLYMFFFQIPGLPEWVLTRRGGAAVGRALRGGSFVREVWTPERTRPYQEAFLMPGAASAALGYYRAALSGAAGFRRAALAHPVAAKTLIIWGTEDRFLGTEFLDERKLSAWFAPGVRPEIARLAGVGHFVQVEAPERVTEAIRGWLAA